MDNQFFLLLSFGSLNYREIFFFELEKLTEKRRYGNNLPRIGLTQCVTYHLKQAFYAV